MTERMPTLRLQSTRDNNNSTALNLATDHKTPPHYSRQQNSSYRLIIVIGILHGTLVNDSDVQSKFSPFALHEQTVHASPVHAIEQIRRGKVDETNVN